MSFDYIFFLIIKITFKYKTYENDDKEITLSYRVRRLYADGSDCEYTLCRRWPGFYISNPDYDYKTVNKKDKNNYEKIWYNNGKVVKSISTQKYKEYEYFDTEGNQIDKRLYEMILQEIKHMFLYHYCNLKKQNNPEMKCCEEHIFRTFIVDGFGLDDRDFSLDDIKEEHNIIKIETCTELIPHEQW